MEVEKDVQLAIRQFSRPSLLRSTCAIVFDWTVIVGIAALSLEVHNFIVSLFSLFIIATRQHALFLLMHDGAHYNLAKPRWLNEWISDFFLAYPIFSKTNAYRVHHFKHHRYLNTDLDPDWVRKKNSPEWRFPMNTKSLTSLAARYLWGWGVVEMYLSLKILSRLNNTRTKLDLFSRNAYYFACLILLYFTHSFGIFFIYWIIPYFTFLPMLMRFRSIAEHFGLENKDELTQSRNVVCSRLERFLFGPHNIGYHLDHHLFPSVPFYNLSRLHVLLDKINRYRDNAHNNGSYIWPLTEKPMISELIDQGHFRRNDTYWPLRGPQQ